MSLQGKRTLVTGGSRGIGFEICKILLENGADVLAVSRDLANLDQAQRELTGLRVLQADVSAAADNERIAEWVRDYWGGLDVLVNNAGVSPHEIGGLYGIPDEEFERTIRINLTGVYLCTKRLIPLLLESDDPRVINVGSTSGVMSPDLRGAYGVSKAALHAPHHCHRRRADGQGRRQRTIARLGAHGHGAGRAQPSQKLRRGSAVAGYSAQGGHRTALPRHGQNGLERVTTATSERRPADPRPQAAWRRSSSASEPLPGTAQPPPRLLP